jgi:ribonucleoside-triphosphate reductase
VFAEHLLLNTLPKDVADSHLSGDLHIANPGIWSLLPDTIFVNLKELIEDGIDLRGKALGVTRIPSIKTMENLTSSLSMIVSLISKEASQEVVMDGLAQLLSKYVKNISDLEQKLADAFATSSTTSQYGRTPTLVSFIIQLGSDQKIVQAILEAYKNYVKITPIPKIGLIIDYEKGKLNDISEILAEIVALGGKIIFSKGSVSSKGILNNDTKNTSGTSIKLQSLSINLPRLAFESNKDETYFRARLALLMKPALSSMSLRKKDISDLTRRGLNPVLAGNTQYMQRSSIALIVNLVGLREAVFGILGYEDNKEGREILHKVIETAVDVAKKKGKEIGDNVSICMTESEGSARFATLDGEKYGKNSVLQSLEGKPYSEGISFDASEIPDLSTKSESIVECNKIAKMLNGGLLTRIQFDKSSKIAEIKKIIEKAADLTTSFKPIKQVPICGNCGMKDEKLGDKCPNCKSPYII